MLGLCLAQTSRSVCAFNEIWNKSKSASILHPPAFMTGTGTAGAVSLSVVIQ